MVQIILFQSLTVPIDPATFPTGYEFGHETGLEYSVDYHWPDARTLVATNRQADGATRRSVLILGEDSRVLREATLRGDTQTVSAEYQYSEGRLRTVRTPRTLRTFHYRGEHLDSIAETDGDTLEGYHKFTYDVLGRLIQSDHHYDRQGNAFTEHRRRKFQHFLPDSIVIEGVYFDASPDSSRAVLYFSGDLPVRMVEVEHTGSGEGSSDMHVWRYGGSSSVREGEARRRLQPAKPGRPERFDLLGRHIRAAGGRDRGGAEADPPGCTGVTGGGAG